MPNLNYVRKEKPQVCRIYVAFLILKPIKRIKRFQVIVWVVK